MRLEVPVPGVRPEQAWGWWTDFRPGAEDHAFAAWSRPERRVEALPEGGWRLTESAQVLGLRFWEEALVTPARPRLRFEARNNFGRFWGHYRFLPATDGARLEVVWEQELVGWLRALGPLGRALLRAFYRWDLRAHIAAMRRDLGGA